MQRFINFRPVTSDDENLLYRIYASTREEELSVLDWDDAQKTEFLQMQFRAQTIHYQKYYQEAQLLVIMAEEKDVGRLYLFRAPQEIRIVDIALLPEARNQGIGTWILQGLLEEGREKEVPVTIHVEHVNPALKLYQRLGFQKIDDTGVYYLMKWSPS